MARMTEEEADYWDEYYTKNPPVLGPNRTGFFTQRRKATHSITIAVHKTPADIISDMVQREIAATR